MKGVNVIFNETTGKRYVQIDMDVIERKREELSDVLGMIIAESRREDEMIPWEKAKKILRRNGKR